MERLFFNISQNTTQLSCSQFSASYEYATGVVRPPSFTSC